MSDRKLESPEPKTSKLSRFSKGASFWILIIATAFLVTQVFSKPQQPAELDYFPEFTRQVEAGNVQEITVINGEKIEGKLRTAIPVKDKQVLEFRTLLPVKNSENLIDRLVAANIAVKSAPARPNWMLLMLQALP